MTEDEILVVENPAAQEDTPAGDLIPGYDLSEGLAFFLLVYGIRLFRRFFQ